MTQKNLQPDFEGDFLLGQGAPFALESGAELPQASLHYAMYGKLNQARDNAILVCHALTGSARVADWWPDLFRDGHPLDTGKHCVIGINVLGSCYGSTGPKSVNSCNRQTLWRGVSRRQYPRHCPCPGRAGGTS